MFSDPHYNHCIDFCVYSTTSSYRIAQNFDGGKFDVFDAFQLDRQNFPPSKFCTIRYMLATLWSDSRNHCYKKASN